MKLDIDQKRLATELDALGAISQEVPPVVTRVVFTEADVRGREYVKDLCREAGLTVREDAVGNTFARWPGEDPDLAPVGTGSHIDAIPNAGRFDGTVGVLGGLEAIRALMRAGYQPRRSDRAYRFSRPKNPRDLESDASEAGFCPACWTPSLRINIKIATVSPWMMPDLRQVSMAHCHPCAWRRDIIPPSLKCTSNKDRFWSSTTCRWGWSRRSPRLPASK